MAGIRPFRAMALDEGDWWPSDEKRISRILRYQLALLGSVAVLRLETTQPGDLRGEHETEGHQYGLVAADCELLGRHLLELAATIRRNEKPMN